MITSTATKYLLITAAKKATTIGVISSSLTLPLTVAGLAGIIGLHGVAVSAAFLGVLVRGIRNRIEPRAMLTELAIYPAIAFVFAYFHPKWIDVFLGEMPEHETALMLGFILGFAPTFVFTFVVDMINRKREAVK